MLYVSPVQGRIVPRYGTANATRNASIIGARRDPKTRAILWDLESIVLLTDEEERLFSLEYEGHIREGDLVRRSADDYAAYQQVLADRKKSAAERPKPGAAAPAQAPSPGTEPAPNPAPSVTRTPPA